MVPNDDPIAETAMVFAALAEALDQSRTPLIQETGLPTSQIRILYTLYYQTDVNIGQLAQHIDVGLPTASYHVEQLVAAELVERRERKTDRRSKILHLTDHGKALIERFQQAPVELMRHWLAQIAPDDVARLHQGLQALAQARAIAPDANDQGAREGKRSP